MTMTPESLDAAIASQHMATIDILEGSRDISGFVYLACNLEKLRQDHDRMGELLDRLQASIEQNLAA